MGAAKPLLGCALLGTPVQRDLADTMIRACKATASAATGLVQVTDGTAGQSHTEPNPRSIRPPGRYHHVALGSSLTSRSRWCRPS
jgi:hypothetical protein